MSEHQLLDLLFDFLDRLEIRHYILQAPYR